MFRKMFIIAAMLLCASANARILGNDPRTWTPKTRDCVEVVQEIDEFIDAEAFCSRLNTVDPFL